MGSFEQAEKKFRDWRGKLIERLRRENLPERDIEVLLRPPRREHFPKVLVSYLSFPVWLAKYDHALTRGLAVNLNSYRAQKQRPALSSISLRALSSGGWRPLSTAATMWGASSVKVTRGRQRAPKAVPAQLDPHTPSCPANRVRPVGRPGCRPVPGIHVCAAARKTWMAGHQGVYARLRRAMPGHDGVIQCEREPL